MRRGCRVQKASLVAWRAGIHNTHREGKMGRRPGLGKWGITKVGVFLAVLGLAMVGWIAPAIASAWLSCDGIDPIIKLNGKQELAIRVDWPSKYSCSIQSPIEVRVYVPAGMEADLVEESTVTTSCGNTVATATSIFNRSVDNRGDQVYVAAKVNATQSFPVVVVVSVDGKVARELRGSSRSGIGGWVSISDK